MCIVGNMFGTAAFVIGLCVGSFLNVVAWRVPRGRSIVLPPSACPSCGRRIRPFENIPVLSWILLGARCAGCGTRIPVRYPLGELAGGLAFLGAWLHSGPTVGFLHDAAFLSLLIVTVQTDLDRWLVLDEVSIGGTAAGLLLSILPGGTGIAESAAAAAGGFLLFLLIRQASILVLRLKPGYVRVPEGMEDDPEGFDGGMGWGDVKLAACIGAFLGPRAAAVGFFLAFLAGASAGLAMMAAGRHRRGVPIPFGPFMAAGAAAALFAGESIAGAYLGYALP
jgi:leader peptidase (prepilin peptidase)/N-methyltransferase